MLLKHPVILVGGTCLLMSGLFFVLLHSGLLVSASGTVSGRIILDMVCYGFWIALCVTIFGIGLAA